MGVFVVGYVLFLGLIQAEEEEEEEEQNRYLARKDVLARIRRRFEGSGPRNP